jgi:hypothetical protein
MRLAATVCMFIGRVGCAMAPTTTTREYLDEQTAATIKVVAEPRDVFALQVAHIGDFLLTTPSRITTDGIARCTTSTSASISVSLSSTIGASGRSRPGCRSRWSMPVRFCGD